MKLLTTLLLLCSLLNLYSGLMIDNFTQGAFSASGTWNGTQSGDPSNIIGGERAIVLENSAAASLVEGSGQLQLTVPTPTSFIWIKYGASGTVNADLSQYDRFSLQLAYPPEHGSIYPLLRLRDSDVYLQTQGRFSQPGTVSFLFSDPEFASLDFSRVTGIELGFGHIPEGSITLGTFQAITAVPEVPYTGLLCAFGLLLATACRKFRRGRTRSPAGA